MYPSPRQRLQLSLRLLLIFLYTLTDSQKYYLHTSSRLCHEYQCLLSFWTHSTKQGEGMFMHDYIQLASLYIHFNGIMNTP